MFNWSLKKKKKKKGGGGGGMGGGQEAKTVHAEDPDKKRMANELVTGY